MLKNMYMYSFSITWKCAFLLIYLKTATMTQNSLFGEVSKNNCEIYKIKKYMHVHETELAMIKI